MNELANVPDGTPVIIQSNEPSGWFRLISQGMDKGMKIEELGRLLDLQERWERDQARKAFDAAFAKFKSEAPASIDKTGHVQYATTKGTVQYDHVELHEAAGKLVPIMARNGLSHSWEIDQSESGLITVACKLSHVGGHSKTTTLRGMPDESGGKNQIQQVASTVSYLQRYTFLAVLGIAQGVDDDGRGAGGKASDEQVKQITSAIKDYPPRALADFFRWMRTATGAERVSDIPADLVPKVIYMIETRAKQQAERNTGNGNGGQTQPAAAYVDPDFGPEPME